MRRVFLLLLLSTGFLLAGTAQAQIKSGVFEQFAGGAFSGTFDTTQSGKLEQTLPAAVGQIISIFLGLIGVILLIIMVYAGFLWLTAGGNEDQVKKAKQWIRNAIIGLIIALSAFLITSFVIQQVQQAVKPPTTQQ